MLGACAVKPVASPSSWLSAGETRLRAYASDVEIDAQVRSAREPKPAFLEDPVTNWGDSSSSIHSPTDPRELVATSIAPVEREQERERMWSHDDYLVVLRGGRLVTIAPSEPSRILGSVEVHPAAEVLVGAGRATVIEAGNETKVAVFRLELNGSLTHEQTFWLRANGSDVPFSRLRGRELTLYVRHAAMGGEVVQLPAFRLHADAPWSRIGTAATIFGGLQPEHVFHTVLRCDLARRPVTCEAHSILGAASQVFHAAQDAVWIWAEAPNRSLPVLYRLPFADGAPGAVHMQGVPVGALSFEESAEERLLRVLVWLRARGAQTESDQPTRAELALARIPMSAVDLSAPVLRRAAYIKLPEAAELTSRFIRGTLLYGPAAGPQLYVYDTHRDDPPRELRLGHGVDRIDPLGDHGALISGRGADRVVLSTLDLEGGKVVDHAVLRDDLQRGMRRVSTVYYQPSSEGAGILALPIHEDRLRVDGVGVEASSEVRFFQQRDLHLERLGSLTTRARSGDAADDLGARPIYAGGRITVLMGGELIEGVLDGNRLKQVRSATIGGEP